MFASSRHSSVVTAFGRTVAWVSAEEHMANYRAARALLVKRTSSVKKGANKSAVKKAKPKK
jgi:hypothetical protein